MISLVTYSLIHAVHILTESVSYPWAIITYYIHFDSLMECIKNGRAAILRRELQHLVQSEQPMLGFFETIL